MNNIVRILFQLKKTPNLIKKLFLGFVKTKSGAHKQLTFYFQIRKHFCRHLHSSLISMQGTLTTHKHFYSSSDVQNFIHRNWGRVRIQGYRQLVRPDDPGGHGFRLRRPVAHLAHPQQEVTGHVPGVNVINRFPVSLTAGTNRSENPLKGSHDTQHNVTQHNDTQHNDTQHNAEPIMLNVHICWVSYTIQALYAEWCYSECRSAPLLTKCAWKTLPSYLVSFHLD